MIRITQNRARPVNPAQAAAVPIIAPAAPVFAAPCRRRAPASAEIIARVAYETGLRYADIVGKSRKAPIARVRFATMWLICDIRQSNLVQIGVALGGRNHTTILHGLSKAEEKRLSDPAFRLLLDRVRTFFDNRETTA